MDVIVDIIVWPFRALFVALEWLWDLLFGWI